MISRVSGEDEAGNRELFSAVVVGQKAVVLWVVEAA
jgi:hypothetical protein